MTYKETIEYLYTALPMFSRIGDAAIKKDLTNTLILCERLGNPHHKFKTVHIAGTNGKGSVSHMLSAVFQNAGYRTGLYTSPHLKDFRERIKVNGEIVSEDFVAQFTQKITPLIAEIQPSFFEITVAMAFEYFAEMQVDVAVIETGLGGRLDSTNVVNPEVSVITNIGMDHMHLLGNTLAAIAFEKAGIIKQDVPVVIGETNAETSNVFTDVSRAKHAPIIFADQVRYTEDHIYKAHRLHITVVNKADNEKKDFSLDLTGLYQAKNVVTVLAVTDALKHKGWNISGENIHAGLNNVKKLTGLHGRWEQVGHKPDVFIDVAHNEDGIKQLVAQAEWMDFHELHIVMGMVKDKDIEKVLALLPKEANYYFTKAQIPRALPENELATKALQYDLHGHHYPDVNTAVKAAIQKAHRDDLIIVCGSVFVVGELEVNHIFKHK
ncbi:MAG: bifunctional folylpolyglutamate synthase/dihydrofolate synthase [Terrimonas sp.]|nr:bifunctional folylpolyglutamate synthase/dihydrofolate synthase [Terrimonas sp.]OJY92141.1 MAG: dihydrofolate synthase [Sphingobacteriales bacterium 40-81]